MKHFNLIKKIKKNKTKQKKEGTNKGEKGGGEQQKEYDARTSSRRQYLSH